MVVYLESELENPFSTKNLIELDICKIKLSKKHT